AQLNAITEKSKEPEAAEPEPEPTTEVLFLCSCEGCGKTFIDAGALRNFWIVRSKRDTLFIPEPEIMCALMKAVVR
ncbi:unnamed protein product, partial [Ilex paraguariensis]